MTSTPHHDVHNKTTMTSGGAEKFALVGRDKEANVIQEAFHRSFIHGATITEELQSNTYLSNDVTTSKQEPVTPMMPHQLMPHQEIVLIEGPSGMGKTTLAIHSLRNSVRKISGFFLVGKFDLTSAQKPYAVVEAMFDQFVKELLKRSNASNSTISSDDDYCYSCIARVRKAIQDAVGSEGGIILTDVIPALEVFVDKQLQNCTDKRDSSIISANSSNSVRRFQSLFCKLCRALAAIVPLVFFFDDLQWADSESLNLIQALLVQSQQNTNINGSNPIANLLVVVARRDDEAFPNTARIIEKSGPGEVTNKRVSVTDFLRELESYHLSNYIKLTKVKLSSLDQASMHHLVANYLKAQPEVCRVLASEVFTKSHGSPLLAMQILKQADGPKQKPADNASSLPENSTTAHEHDVWNKFRALSELGRKILQVSACLGDEVDENAVAVVLGADLQEVHQHVKMAADHGHLVLEFGRGLYRFRHDQIRQAALSMISDFDAFSFRIGHTLWTKSTPLFLSTKMFVIVNLLGHGTNLLSDQAERYKVAALCWESGVKAASMANFTDSSRYLNMGIDFLKGGDYWAEEYGLSLKLFHAAADTEICTQNFGRVNDLVNEVIEKGHTLHDKMPAYVANINYLCQTGCVQKAITIGINVLRQLGETLPNVATRGAIMREVFVTKLAIARCCNGDMLSLPPMENMDKLHALHLLSFLVPYAFQARSLYGPLMGTRMVRLCLNHGFHKIGIVGMVTFAWVTCSYNRREGYRLGLLCLAAVERLRAKDLVSRVHIIFYGFTHHWRRPIRESLEPLQRASESAIEIGDIEGAMWALHLRCINLLSCGCPLAEVEAALKETTRLMTLYKQEHILQLISLTYQLVHNLMGRAPVATELVGEIIRLGDDNKKSDAVIVKFARVSIEANLSFRFGNYARAGELVEQRRRLHYDHVASFNSSTVRQLEILIAISCIRIGQDVKSNYKIARQGLKSLKKWAADCPDNFLCMAKLVEAELASLSHGRSSSRRTLALYDTAITEATLKGFTQQAALAFELAGDYLNRQGEAEMARTYWVEARSKYLCWGATAKANYLSQKHF